MAERDHDEANSSIRKSEELDRALDAALTRYAAVEPRAGLEERVLAHLSGERAKLPARTWWKWSVAIAIAAVFVLAIAMGLRPGRPSHPVIAIQPPAPDKPTHATQAANPAFEVTPRRRMRTHSMVARRSEPGALVAILPKLDQFPSPSPLSDQEKILLSYVAEDPERAALIAEARTKALREDAKERAAIANGERD